MSHFIIEPLGSVTKTAEMLSVYFFVIQSLFHFLVHRYLSNALFKIIVIHLTSCNEIRRTWGVLGDPLIFSIRNNICPTLFLTFSMHVLISVELLSVNYREIIIQIAEMNRMFSVTWYNWLCLHSLLTLHDVTLDRGINSSFLITLFNDKYIFCFQYLSTVSNKLM